MNACRVWSPKILGISFFRLLLDANANPDDLTFSLLMKAFASSFSSDTCNSAVTELQASQVQTQLVRRGINQFVYVNTALLDFYMKLGLTTNARQLFEDMPCRDMLREGFRPDHATIVGLAPACGRFELILQGGSLHGFGIKAGLGFDGQLKNALSSILHTNSRTSAGDLGEIQKRRRCNHLTSTGCSVALTTLFGKRILSGHWNVKDVSQRFYRWVRRHHRGVLRRGAMGAIICRVVAAAVLIGCAMMHRGSRESWSF
ncbi:hypothetical protein K1719_010738 [Acacia pycnantha]|nr:hypothetical protein K1719_010738 [Acacia pycnantha]